MSTAQFRVAGICFEHMHMGDNLQMVADHPACEIVGICDTDATRMQAAIAELNIHSDRIYTDWQQCIEQSRPDWLILCPSTADHSLWVDRLAPYGLPILLEKPMASCMDDAQRMAAACASHDVLLAINWPLVWVPSHRTAKRLVDEGTIGRVIEVHYYDGNRGPLWHTAGKRTISADEVQRQKPDSWFYKKSAGGGSLLDYLGYGVTLGAWFLQDARPLEVTAIVDQPLGLEVDEHSITVVRFDVGLSKFETRWGTFTDPWIAQPQPQCGFVLVGTQGTISSYDYAAQIRVQTRANPAGYNVPADQIEPPFQNPVQYFVDCLQHGKQIEGPLSLATSLAGQRIVDAARQSADSKRTICL